MNKKTIVQEESMVVNTDIQSMSVDIQKDTSESTVQSITFDELEVEDANIIDIEMSEAFQFSGNGLVSHSALGGRESSDQHPIDAITGLRDELDVLYTTERIYSTNSGLGEYRRWHDGNPKGEDRSGYFVAIVPGTDEIEICDTTHDVYGIAVSYSGFIGNQNELYQKGNVLVNNKANDLSYAVVGIVGSMRVRTDGKARNGDYVVPNAYGEATLSDNKYGYKVLSQGSYPSYSFVTIAITPQSDALSRLESSVAGGNLGDLIVKIDGIDDKIDKVTIRIDTSEEEMKEIIDELGGMQSSVASAESIATEAKTIAEDAKTEAAQAKNDAIQIAQDARDSADGAVNSANSALSDIAGLSGDLQPILEWSDTTNEYNNGVQGFVAQINDDHTKLASIMSGDFGDGENLAAIIQKVDAQGAVIQHLTSHIDKYTVGSYSLTYGLTYNEATSVLAQEHIYVPTTAYEERLNVLNADGEVIETKTFIFEKPDQHLYSYKWIPENGTWEKQSRLVYSSNVYIDGTDVNLDVVEDDLWYCTQDIIDVPDGIDPLKAGNLYIWTGSVWNWVASVDDNYQSRIITNMRQTEESIISDVVALDGRTASVEQSVDKVTTRVTNAEGDISIINQNIDTINSTIATANGNISSLQQHANTTDASITAIASGTFPHVYQEFAGDAPNSYDGKKYTLPPVWNDTDKIFVFDENSAAEDGAYYFHSEDQTKYCCVKENGYCIYTVGKEATAMLDNRITDAEANITSLVEFNTSTTTSLANINEKVNQNESSITYLTSRYNHILLRVSTEEVPMFGEYRYTKEPNWNAGAGEYEFDPEYRSDNGIYYMADEYNQSYCKVIIPEDGTTGDGELVVNGNGIMGDNTNFTVFNFDATQTNNSFGSFVTPESSKLYQCNTTNYISIDRGKDYVLSIDAKSLNGLATNYLNLVYYNSNNGVLSNSSYIALFATVAPAGEWRTYQGTLHGSDIPENATYAKVRVSLNYNKADDLVWFTNVSFKEINTISDTALYEIYGLVGGSLAAVEQKVDENSASIGLVVEQQGENKVVKGSVIISAINDAQSEAVINANRIKLSTEDTSSDIAQYILGKTNELQNSINELSGSIDTKVDYYWQSDAPYNEYYSVSSNDVYDSYIGDFWYDTNNQITRKYVKIENGTNIYNYIWEDQMVNEVPQEVFDKIDGKKSIYTSCPNSFSKNDLWIYEGITEDNGLEENGSANKEAPYKPHSNPKVYYQKNDLLVATIDSYEYSPSGWTQYNPNIVKMNPDCSIIINDESVNITNGTMNLTRTDGNSRIILEPSEGIKIQKLSVNNEWTNQFYADDDGDLIITGAITATAGYVGGWKIEKDRLCSDDVGLHSGEALGVEEGDYQYPSLIDGYSTIRVWAGNEDPQLANFIVLNDGSLYANAVSITGTIYSDHGSIGGWDISENGLSHSSGEFYLNSDGTGRIGLMTFSNSYASFNGDIYANNLVVGSVDIDGNGTTVDVGYINNSHIEDNSIDPNKLYASYVDGVTESIAAVQVYADSTFATTESVANIQKDIYDEFGNYVQTSALNASIGTYIDSEAGTSQIISTCASTYQTKEDMDDYLTNVDLNNTVEQYIDSAAGTSKIISACSSVYQKKEDMDNYLTDVNINSTIEQYIDSTTGTSKIISACSGTYQKQSDMTKYATTSSISQTVSDKIATLTLSTSTSTNNNQTTSTITLKNGNTTITSASVTGTTSTQVSSIVADAIDGIEFSVTNGEKSSTFTLKSGSTTLSSGTIQFTGNVVFASDLSTSGKTTINGANITTGTISADRIDTGSLKLDTLYVGNKIGVKGEGNYNSTLYVGGNSSSSLFDNVYIKAEDSIVLGSWSRSTGLELLFGSTETYLRPLNNTTLGNSVNRFSALYVDKIYFGSGAALLDSPSRIYRTSTSTDYIEFNNSMELLGSSTGFKIGNSATPFAEAYLGQTAYHLKIKDASIVPNTTVYGTSSSYFNLGSSSYPFTSLHVKEIYLNGTKLGGGADMSGSDVKMGGNSSYHIVCNTSRELRPNGDSSYYPCYLGTSNYYWHYAYIGSNTVSIGESSSSKLGFFGATPVARQTLSTSYNDMSYSSATSSNYLTILNNLVGILKNKYGLIY